MEKLVAALENKEPNLLEEMLSYLSDWWQSHITQSDMRYARYIRANAKE